MNSRPPSPDSGDGKPRRPGFTLIELVIVIGVMAVVLAATLPFTVRFYQSQLVEETAQAFVETLRRAQSRASAAQGDSPHGVKILPTGYVLFRGASYAARVATEDEVETLPSSITVTSTATEVVFSKLYATSSLVGTISVIGAGGTVEVTVNAAGKIEAP